MKSRTFFGYIASVGISLAVGFYIGRSSSPAPDPLRSSVPAARSLAAASVSTVQSLASTSAPTSQAKVASVKKSTKKSTVTSAPRVKYVLNKNTKKFHKESCASVKQMKESNKEIVDWSRSEIINAGYDPCGRCNP